MNIYRKMYRGNNVQRFNTTSGINETVNNLSDRFKTFEPKIIIIII